MLSVVSFRRNTNHPLCCPSNWGPYETVSSSPLITSPGMFVRPPPVTASPGVHEASTSFVSPGAIVSVGMVSLRVRDSPPLLQSKGLSLRRHAVFAPTMRSSPSLFTHEWIELLSPP